MTPPLVPPATIGIIGGGQLGMMLVREAQRMGYRSVVWDPDPACPAARLADNLIPAPFTDAQAALRLAEAADAVTYEFENVDPELVRRIEALKPLRPGSAILALSRNRIAEKSGLLEHGFAVVRHAIAGAGSSPAEAIAQIGLPVVVKTATAGYDGKGQTVLKSEEDRARFLKEAGRLTSDHVVEEFVPLLCELSVLAARGADGSVVTFPVTENEHRGNILHMSRVPAHVPPDVTASAAALARDVVGRLGVTGLLCVEMFVARDGRLLVNELAPRPHNSGHYTLDACDCSQFEMLLRVLCGLPLPVPRLLSPCAMVNLLGMHLERVRLQDLFAVPGAKIHLYGKARTEPRRKMGHVTVLAPDAGTVDRRTDMIRELIGETPETTTERVKR
jgi:5-(carboxyamino)imidazole ribonucleotide synthase